MNEQNQKFRNRIGVKSSVPGLATVLCVLALGCVLAAFWPAMFADVDAPNGGTALVLHIVYGTLSLSLLLFAISAGALAKRNTVFMGIFAIPVCTYYFIERSGLLQYALFYRDQSVFAVYENNLAYFSGRNLAMIVLVTLFSLLSMWSFSALCFHRVRHKALNVAVLAAALVVRVAFSCMHVAQYELPLYRAGAYALDDVTYAILQHIAGVLFFAAMAAVAFAMRKTEFVPRRLRAAGEQADGADNRQESAAVPLHEERAQTAAETTGATAEDAAHFGNAAETERGLQADAPAEVPETEAAQTAAVPVSEPSGEPVTSDADMSAEAPKAEAAEPQDALPVPPAEEPAEKPKRKRAPRKAKEPETAES